MCVLPGSSRVYGSCAEVLWSGPGCWLVGWNGPALGEAGIGGDCKAQRCGLLVRVQDAPYLPVVMMRMQVMVEPVYSNNSMQNHVLFVR